jgi:cytochrome c5
MKINYTFLLALLFFFSCGKDEPTTTVPTENNDPIIYGGTTPLPVSVQRQGNATLGEKYLLYGDSLTSGIPYALFKQFFPTDFDLGRTGDNKGISYKFTAHNASNGIRVVSPNCMTCHAESIDGKVILGLGNNTSDYTIDQSTPFNTLDEVIVLYYGNSSKEEAAYKQFSKASKAIGKGVITKTRGVNPADKVFAILAAHRNQKDLIWNDTPSNLIPNDVVPTDVPAWWLLKKKNALYYNAIGSGDFSRLSSASGLLTMKDSSDARVLDKQMVDIIAYIKTLKAPAFTQQIDKAAADKGKIVFVKNCSSCHGKYGAEESYPNLLVDLNTIGTDPLLANTYKTYPEYNQWYNNSWYNKNPGMASLLPTSGYIAPPLDGIWATAPYLHNGSVATLEELLNSKTRAKYWQRNFDNKSYDYTNIGWKYILKTSKENSETYDTTLPGYSNSGHTFGDKLTTEERKHLIEYLKGL